MKTISTNQVVRAVSLCLAIVLVSSGCGRLRRHEGKPPGKLHSVTVTWTPSVSKVVGYNVYRNSAPGSPLQKLNSQPVTDARFTDTQAVGGMKYSYYATSVDAQGFESTPSNPTSVSIPYP